MFTILKKEEGGEKINQNTIIKKKKRKDTKLKRAFFFHIFRNVTKGENRKGRGEKKSNKEKKHKMTSSLLGLHASLALLDLVAVSCERRK